MKRIAWICAALMAVSAVLLGGCGGEQSSETAETTAAATQDEAVTTDSEQVKTNISELHAIDYEGNDFAGAWKITEREEGETYPSFVYMFDGNDKATLMVGTMGYCEHYQVNPDIKQFACQLAFGINGKYTYEFSEDKNSVTLTNVDTKAVTKLDRIMSFAYIPLPDPNAVIDEQLVGAWADDSGGYLYFDDQGIMYETQKAVSFTYYNYSAENGKVSVKYYAPDEQQDSFDYKIEGDTLTFNDYEYHRVSEDELP